MVALPSCCPDFLLINQSAEHSHAHETPRVSRAPSITSPSASQSVLGDLVPSQTIPKRQRRRSRASISSDFSTLYGHPAATRASLVQTANELAKARSPSPSARRHSVSLSPDADHEDALLSSDLLAEDTPLLHNEQNGKNDHNGHHGHSHAGSMNMRALVLHVIGDALGNVGVIATGLVIWLTEWSFKYYFDPCISLVITIIIFSSAVPLGWSFFSDRPRSLR
jgi:zinc transporter 1